MWLILRQSLILVVPHLKHELDNEINLIAPIISDTTVAVPKAPSINPVIKLLLGVRPSFLAKPAAPCGPVAPIHPVGPVFPVLPVAPAPPVHPVVSVLPILPVATVGPNLPTILWVLWVYSSMLRCVIGVLYCIGFLCDAAAYPCA